MAKNSKDIVSSEVVSKKDKIFNGIVLVLLCLGAVIMVFPLIYMVATSFMTKNQILSGQLSIIPDPWVFGKYAEVLNKGNFISGICAGAFLAAGGLDVEISPSLEGPYFVLGLVYILLTFIFSYAADLKEENARLTAQKNEAPVEPTADTDPTLAE